jgi:hypothetical protein
MLKHQALHWGYANEEIKAEIEKKDLEKSAPSEQKWRDQVLRSSDQFFAKIFERLGEL